MRTGSEKQLKKVVSHNYDPRYGSNNFMSPKTTYEVADNVSDFGFLKNFEKRKWEESDRKTSDDYNFAIDFYVLKRWSIFFVYC